MGSTCGNQHGYDTEIAGSAGMGLHGLRVDLPLQGQCPGDEGPAEQGKAPQHREGAAAVS